MAVQLVVEDGTGIANANTFVIVADVRSYATQRGIDSLPVDDDLLSSMIVEACDYIMTYEPRMNGERNVPETQALCYPRKCVNLFGVDLDPAFIPEQLKTAQIQVVIAVSTGIELFPTQTGPDVTRETIGPITTEYLPNSWAASNLPTFSNVNATIAPLLIDGQSGYKWRTVRV